MECLIMKFRSFIRCYAGDRPVVRRAVAKPRRGQQSPKMGGTLRYGTVTEVASLDPHVYSGSA
jgi:hypothetical protein